MEDKKNFNAQTIVKLLKKFRNHRLDFITIYKDNMFHSPDGIIFFKPEICDSSPKAMDLVINYFISLAQKYYIYLKNSYIISSSFLVRNNIINQIYAPIMKNALIAEDNVKEHFTWLQIPKEMKSYISIKGGLTLEKDGYSAEFLMNLWLNASYVLKVEDNFYVTRVVIEGLPILLVNGFFPYQQKQYSENGKKIILFTFQTSEDFIKLKKEFQGNLDKDEKNLSIRRYFLFLKKKNLLKDISNSRNGIHMSSNRKEGQKEASIFINAINKNLG